MVRWVVLLKRKPGMTKEEFRRHYETSHVALAKKYYGHLFLDYRRRYVQSGITVGEAGLGEAPGVAYDVVTSVALRDKAALDEFLRILAIPEVHEAFVADEERFLDRPASRMMFVDEVSGWSEGEAIKPSWALPMPAPVR
jgi:hypothetical protein